MKFKHAVLRAIMFCGPECGTVDVRHRLEECGKGVTIGRLYAAIDSLERAGLIWTSYRPGGPERNNLHRKVLWLTDSGLVELSELDNKAGLKLAGGSK